MPVISTWLESATTQLQESGITSARLDAEIILAHTLRKGRTYLHAHPDEEITTRELEIADSRLLLRLDRVPIAYIIGHKDFYGRQFNVTTATLIPRPESEDLIDVVLALVPRNLTLFSETFRIVDVGTGSGCLGITLKLELPETEVTLLDVSPYALKVAASNASQLQADVRIIKSDLLLGYPFQSNIIVANLPYVDPLWERSPETNHEPSLALFADDGGLALIIKLINQTGNSLKKQGLLVLESDPTQHDAIVKYAESQALTLHSKKGYILALKKS